jgi:single-stranded DNA-binding protein
MIVNSVLLSGMLFEEPVLHTTEQGRPYSLLKLSSLPPPSQEIFGGPQKTHFFCIATFDSVASACINLPVGTKVFVEGRLISHEYEDEAGELVSCLKIYAQSVQIDSNIMFPHQNN